jgi:hypothetical protein
MPIIVPLKNAIVDMCSSWLLPPSGHAIPPVVAGETISASSMIEVIRGKPVAILHVIACATIGVLLMLKGWPTHGLDVWHTTSKH